MNILDIDLKYKLKVMKINLIIHQIIFIINVLNYNYSDFAIIIHYLQYFFGIVGIFLSLKN